MQSFGHKAFILSQTSLCLQSKNFFYRKLHAGNIKKIVKRPLEKYFFEGSYSKNLQKIIKLKVLMAKTFS